jgi:hypothetical protein
MCRSEFVDRWIGLKVIINMARFVPDVFPPFDGGTPERKRGWEGEKQVYDALRKSLGGDGDFTVIHSYEIDNHDGEADFLIFHKKLGLIILEAKNWSVDLQYDAPNDQWFRIDRKGIRLDQRGKNPLKRARQFGYDGIDKLWRMRGKKGRFPCVRGGLAIFVGKHGIRDYHQKNPNMYADQQYLDYPEKLKEWILTSYGEYMAHHDIRPMSPQVSKDVEKFLRIPFFSARIAFYAEKDEFESYIKNKTRAQQMRIVKDHLKRANWVVVGEAGTGKSYVGMQVASQLLKEGKKGLFLVYNTMVSELLNQRLISEFQVKNFNVQTISGHIQEALKFSSLVPFNPERKDTQRLIEKYRNSAKSLAKYDFVVVDEAQDLGYEMISALRERLKDRSRGLYVFVDPKQNILARKTDRHKTAIDDIKKLEKDLETVRIELPQVVRNSFRIVNFIEEAVPLLKLEAETLPIGFQEPGIPKPVKSYQGYRDETLKVIKDWQEKYGVSTDEIVVIGNQSMPAYFPRASKGNVGRLGDQFKLVTSGEASAEHAIKFRRYSQFKGCESVGVIVWWQGNWPLKTRADQEEFYVSCSRAKHLLYVITKEK